MNIICIIHADFETPGVIENWANYNNHSLQIKKPYTGEKLPEVDNFDMFIFMGGPQSPLNMEAAPYLKNEISLIKECISKNKKLLGFCLGAQLIGEALGASTERSPEKEVGVYPIWFTDAGKKDPLLKEISNPAPVIHWHNDMPGLLNDSILLAYSQGCPRQIVRYKPNIYGFQCHLEMTRDNIITMIESVPDDLRPSKYTQTIEQILSQDYDLINAMMIKFLDRFSEG